MDNLMIDWHFPRQSLAEGYMNAFATGITGSLALFAPRRMGKSEFCLLDLAPLAEQMGYRVGYCSFWNLKDNPAKALRLSLEEIDKKGRWKEKWASYVSNTSSEISANLAGASFKVKSDIPKVEEDDLIAIIELLGNLARGKKKVLLICDEVQHLADERHASLVATLRTQFDQHRSKLHVVFTGSSRDGLQRLFRSYRAAMFHAAQNVDFPPLGAEFCEFMLDAFYKASQQKLNLAEAVRIFKKLNNNPALFHHLLRHMVISGIWEIDEGFKHFDKLIDTDADFSALWNECKAIDQAILKQLTTPINEGLYSDMMRERIASEVGVDEVSVKSVQYGIERLRNNQVIYNIARGSWAFEDPSFKEWIINNKLDTDS